MAPKSNRDDHEQYRLALVKDKPSSVEVLAESVRPTEVETLEPQFSFSPNPHFGDFATPGTPPKNVLEPYTSDISAGKNTYVYDAHTYHTKVPPQGIRVLIEHYTRVGDTILDPFCGSGMTGVAALEAGRKALLSDLSPAAAFIAYNHCTPIDHKRFLKAVKSLLTMTRDWEERLYRTPCRDCGEDALLLYMVWSFGLICPECDEEFVLWDVARHEGRTIRESKIKKEFDCPHCGAHIAKRGLKRTKRYPVQVGYRCCAGGLKEQTAPPNEQDLALLAELEELGVPAGLWYPTDQFPDGVNTKQAIHAGITSVDKAYTTRGLTAMAVLWDLALRWPEPELRPKLVFVLTSLYRRVTLFSEFRFWGGSGNTANYNVPAIANEQNVFKTFERKANTISWYFRDAPKVERNIRVSVQSAAHLSQLPSKSVDYVFTDPPFGSNINYSEMNYLWESWLRVHTDQMDEAIVNKVQGKGLDEYQALLKNAFSEVRRILKDDAWLTVVFHNSSAKVWQALQKALSAAGFAIVGTQTFDKKHGTFKQFVSDNAVGYDLVLHCKKAPASSTALPPDRDGVEAEIRSFVRAAIENRLHLYRTEYLHVRRDAEFDHRRLYAEWLTGAVVTSGIVMSFEDFRVIVEQELAFTQTVSCDRNGKG